MINIKGVIIFTIIVFIISILISFLNYILFKEESKEEILLSLLPGYNCASCGFNSCIGMAKALLKDKNVIDKCKFIKNKEEILNVLGGNNE